MRYSMAQSEGGQAVTLEERILRMIPVLDLPSDQNELRAIAMDVRKLDKTLEAITDKLDDAWGIYMQFKEPKP